MRKLHTLLKKKYFYVYLQEWTVTDSEKEFLNTIHYKSENGQYVSTKQKNDVGLQITQEGIAERIPE